MRVAICLFILFSAVSLGEAILDSDDKLALQSLADYWTTMQNGSDSWDIGTIDSACTAWRGILCQSFDGGVTDRITGFALGTEPLNSYLPWQITLFPELRSLNLSKTGSTGMLFTNWANLSQIEHISLSSNALTGSIPGGISVAVNLKTLDLSSNRLSSTVPTGLQALSNLEVLNVTGNSLRGWLTSWFEFWPKLKIFSASNNPLWTWQATYSIAPTIKNCPNLAIFEYGGNQAQLPLPPEMGDLLELEQLNMPNSYLHAWPNITGLPKLKKLLIGFQPTLGNISVSLPDDIGSMTELETLIIYTGLVGTIPEGIGQLTKLKYLDLNLLKLSGIIPQTIGNLANLEYLDLSGNKNLSGSLPDAINDMTKLVNLKADRCNLTGFPTSVSQLVNLRVLSVSWNRISQLPTGLGSLTSLRRLILNNNAFVGSLPAEIGLLENLEMLSIGSNDISIDSVDFSRLTQIRSLAISNIAKASGFPNSISVMKNLTSLNLAANDFVGEIDDDFFDNMTSLRSVILAGNNISGTLPSSLAGLTSLTVLDASNNNFSSPIPDLSHLGLLQLSLNSNNFDGTVPEWLATITTTISQISLAHNRFSGTLPAAFGAPLHPYYQIDLSYNELVGGLPDTLNENSTLANILLHHNRMHFCPTNITSLPENLYCYLPDQDRWDYDCGCEIEVFTQCVTSPPRLHRCIPCESDIPPSETKLWQCREGYYFYDARNDSRPESKVAVFESSVLVLGDFVAPVVTFHGLWAQFNVSRCLNVSEILIYLSDDDAQYLYDRGGVFPRKLINTGFEFLFDSSECPRDNVPLIIHQPSNACLRVSSTSTNTNIDRTGGFVLGLQFSKSDSCKSKFPWWGIMLAVILSLALIITVIILVATFVPKVRNFFRPFYKRRPPQAQNL